MASQAATTRELRYCGAAAATANSGRAVSSCAARSSAPEHLATTRCPCRPASATKPLLVGQRQGEGDRGHEPPPVAADSAIGMPAGTTASDAFCAMACSNRATRLRGTSTSTELPELATENPAGVVEHLHHGRARDDHGRCRCVGRGCCPVGPRRRRPVAGRLQRPSRPRNAGRAASGSAAAQISIAAPGTTAPLTRVASCSTSDVDRTPEELPTDEVGSSSPFAHRLGHHEASARDAARREIETVRAVQRDAALHEIAGVDPLTGSEGRRRRIHRDPPIGGGHDSVDAGHRPDHEQHAEHEPQIGCVAAGPFRWRRERRRGAASGSGMGTSEKGTVHRGR